MLAYLPPAWIGQNIFCYAQWLACGYVVNCPESASTVTIDMKEIGPTYYFAPPRIFEGLLTSVMIRMEDAGRLKRWLFHTFMGVARRAGPARMDGKRLGAGDALLYALGNLFIYGPLRNTLGMSRVRVAYTAGEAIGPDLFTFYRSIGINLKQLYGSTETAVFVCLQPDNEARSDTVGVPIAGVEIEVDDNGEILIRSPGLLKEYYKNPAATAEVKTAEGWYRSGDAGFLDASGHLKIIDRAKDVGRIKGGANDGAMFAPKYVENKLKFFPHIKEAVAFGDGREKACAFINIDFEAVGNWAEKRNLPYAGYTDLAQKPEVLRADPRLRGEGQCRPGAGREAGRQPGQPLPDPAQGARRRRRRADAHPQGPPRLHRRQVRRAGRCAVRGPQRAIHRDAGQVRGRAHRHRRGRAAHRRCQDLPAMRRAA